MRISIPTLLVALASIISAFSEPKNGLQTAKVSLDMLTAVEAVAATDLATLVCPWPSPGHCL